MRNCCYRLKKFIVLSGRYYTNISNSKVMGKLNGFTYIIDIFICNNNAHCNIGYFRQVLDSY